MFTPADRKLFKIVAWLFIPVALTIPIQEWQLTVSMAGILVGILAGWGIITIIEGKKGK